MAEYEFLELEDNEAIKREYRGYADGLVRLKKGDWTFQPSTAKLLPEYKSMEVRQSDVWIVTYPKCGTTWSQELIWQVVHGVDLEGGKKDLNERFPFLELDTLLNIKHILPNIFLRSIFKFFMWWSTFSIWRPSSWLGYANAKEQMDDVPAEKRRFIKSHLPLSLLPSDLVTKAKVVYVVRNPLDVLVSYYHHHKLITAHGYVGDLPSFAQRFMRNEIMQGPFFPHVHEAWAIKDHPNLLFIFYEDMKKDLRNVIARVSKFLEAPLTPEQVERLVEHLDIKNFRNNPAVNPTDLGKIVGFMTGSGNFVRSGKVGGWKEEFAAFPEVEAELKSWVEEQLAHSPVQFPV